MKYSKRYIAFTGVLAVALLIKFNNFGEQYQTVNRFRGAQLEETTWNPLIAQSVNDGLLSVVIDNKEYTNEKYPFFKKFSWIKYPTEKEGFEPSRRY